jgi:hypothetical protein
MTWQVPGEASATPEVASTAAAAPASSSLILAAAHSYIDNRAAKMALQAAAIRAAEAKGAAAKANAVRSNDMTSFAQFERKCLKKVSKRRNAKLVHVPCSPLQGAPSQATASLTSTDKVAR